MKAPHFFKAASLPLAFALSLIAAAAMAQPRGRRPPPEAFSACEQQDEGSQCLVETPHGQLEGVCRIPPQAPDERLVCVPNRPPRR